MSAPAPGTGPPPLPRRRRAGWMRRIAAFAGLLLLLHMFPGDVLFGPHALGSFLSFLTVLSVVVSAGYYVSRGIAWLWRHLMWRVRRRLAVTYLFIGVTPILLLGLLGLISWFGLSAEGMARLVTVQIESMTRSAGGATRGLVEGLTRLPDPLDDRAARAWLDERIALLRTSLPGARVALFRGETGPDGGGAPARLLSPSNESAVPGAAPLEAPLPAWLAPEREWSGLTHAAPPATPDGLGMSSVRALARGVARGRPFSLLLEVPLDDRTASSIREASGVAVRPHRPGAKDFFDDRGGGGQSVLASGLPYVVMAASTEWTGGASAQRGLFTFGWSWPGAARLFFGSSLGAMVWKRGLYGVAVGFFVLELLALLAGAWMTRAITVTVHELSRGTEHIDRGDFSHRVRVRSRDQLGQLSRAFNDMAAHVEALLLERVSHERLQREVEIAAQVQTRLLPRSAPKMRTAEIAGECRPARGVGGDYYDYLEIAPGLVAVALGDVAGKGLPASLLMSNLQASLRAQAPFLAGTGRSGRGNGHDTVAGVASIVNEQLCRSIEANRFASLFLGLYDDATRTLRYTNAGHNAAILARADGSIERLSIGGTMVGAFPESRYEQASAALPPASMLMVFSDGISEARDAAGQEFGEGRLVEFAARNRGLDAGTIQKALFEEIDRWSKAEERDDDQTLVIVKTFPDAG